MNFMYVHNRQLSVYIQIQLDTIILLTAGSLYMKLYLTWGLDSTVTIIPTLGKTSNVHICW